MFKQPGKIDISFVEARKKNFENLCLKYGLDMLYIYGSLAKNKMNLLSDIDVAVLKSSGKIVLEQYSSILADLQEIFKREDIDLVDLFDAPAVLKDRILRNGRLIYARSEKSLKSFRYKTIIDYLSSSYLRKNFSRYMKMALEAN